MQENCILWIISRVWIPDCPIIHSDFFGFDLVSETLFLIEDFFLKFRLWIRHLMSYLDHSRSITNKLTPNQWNDNYQFNDSVAEILVLVQATMLQCIGERIVFAQRPTTFDIKTCTVRWCNFISHYRCYIEVTWAVRVSRGVMLYRVTGIMPVYFGNDVINK